MRSNGHIDRKIMSVYAGKESAAKNHSQKLLSLNNACNFDVITI